MFAEERYKNLHLSEKCSLLLLLKYQFGFFFYVRLNPAALLWSVAQITSYLNYKLYYDPSFDLTGLSKSYELFFALSYNAGMEPDTSVAMCLFPPV